jgi:MFS transporter, PPP family, 3-phenylpropionic acid transporter
MSTRRVMASSWANYFFLSLANGILMPYLPLYLKARGLPASRIGVLLGCLELAGMAGPMLLGRLADKKAAYRGILAACFIIPMAVMLPMEWTMYFPLFLACIAVLGFTYRATIPLLDSLVSRILADPARQYGQLRVAGSFGFIAISLIVQLTGWVSGDTSGPMLVAFLAAESCAALAVAFLPAAPRLPVSARQGLAEAPLHPAARPFDGFDTKFWAVMGVIFLGRFGIGAYYSFFSLYLKEAFPSANVSLLWAIGPLAEILTIWFSGPLIRRWGIRALLIVSLSAISLRLGLFIVAPTILFVALAQLLHAFTFGTFHTSAVAFVNEKIGHENRGVGMAIYSAGANGLPALLSSAAGGYILQERGFTALFTTYAAVPLVGILILAAFGRRLLPRRQVPGSKG